MTNNIAATAKICSGVILGENIVIEDYCIIGVPVKGDNKADTVIGDNAVIRSHTVIYAGNTIGNNFQTGNKANIREFNTIGDNVSIGTLSVIEHHVKICDNVRIHSQVFIPEYTVLKKNCWVGPNVVMTNAKYPNSPQAKQHLTGPTIKENAVIGANTTLLPGIIVGEKSIIGAGSVVTKNVADFAVVTGNPALPINNRHTLPY